MKTYKSQILCLAFIAPTATLGSEANNYSIGIGYHGYQPQFDDLFNGAYKTPLSASTNRLTISSNTLDADDHIGSLGVTISYQLFSNIKITTGFNQWDQSTINSVEEEWPFQRTTPQYSALQRSATIEFKDFHIGLEQQLPTNSQLFNPFWGITFHHIPEVSYKERYLFTYADPAFGTIHRTLTTTFEGIDLNYLLFSFGNEFFFTQKLSAKVAGGYAYTNGAQQLTQGQVTSDFHDSDGLLFHPPTSIGDDGFAHYIKDPSVNLDEYSDIKLGFKGWQFAFTLSYYF